MSASRNKIRRVRHDIISEILEIGKRGVLKTKIMYRTRLSYQQLKKYLNALEKAGLIKNESGLWRTTKSGVKVIEACKICQGLVNQLAFSKNEKERTNPRRSETESTDKRKRRLSQ
jgi:predicted transcriptional regulator